MSVERRRQMIETEHPSLSVVRQCELVSISRSSFHHQPVGETAETLALMRLIDAQFLETPWHGSRQMARHLRRDGHEVGRKRVRRLMALMGLVPICQRPRTTVPNLAKPLGLRREHRIFSTWSRWSNREVRPRWTGRPGRCWPGLHAAPRHVPPGDRFAMVSNTMDVEFCVEALEEASARFGQPEIFNTDQGSQFTSPRFTEVLRQAGTRISMDGRGRWMDNVFIERLWRSLKHECVYLHAFETGSELRAGLAKWIGYYNTLRPHSTSAGRTPDEAYGASVTERLAA